MGTSGHYFCTDYDMPVRIQRKRTRGWRMPENTVSVTRPGRYGNPYHVEEYGRAEAMRLFEDYLKSRLEQEPEFLEPLRGKNLACYCDPSVLCHADILLRYANR